MFKQINKFSIQLFQYNEKSRASYHNIFDCRKSNILTWEKQQSKLYEICSCYDPSLVSDKISVETLKASDHFGLKLLQLLADAVYNKVFPNELYKSTFITLPKNLGAVDSEIFCTISIISHVTKVILRVIMIKIRNKMHPEIFIEQYGFMKNKETKNASFVLGMQNKWAIEIQHTMYLCFADWNKAIDRVNHEGLLQLLNKIGIDRKDVRLIQALHYKQTANVKIGKDVTGEAQIKKGVRQGCVLSQDLFNLFSESILCGTNDLEKNKGDWIES